MSQPTDGYEATMRLARERPDLIPLLRSLLALERPATADDAPQADLDELTRRGLLVASCAA